MVRQANAAQNFAQADAPSSAVGLCWHRGRAPLSSFVGRLFPPAAIARIILLTSPTVFREGGFRFYFFSRQKSRIYVHVQGQNGELFLPFTEFPWFHNVPVGKILNVELPSSGQLYWPDLDVDLAVESVRHPEKFPLVSRVGA
jgi:hypothetical protein